MKFLDYLSRCFVLCFIVAMNRAFVYSSPAPTAVPTKNPSIAPTTRAPTSPTKSPTFGCNDDDKELWETKYYFTFKTYMDKCGKSSAGDRAEAKECLAEYQIGLSESCSTCFVDLIVCTRDFCLAPCINGGQENPLCVDCVLEFCDDTFTACSTFFTNECEGCVEVTEPPTIVDGLPDGALYGIIAGGVAFIGVAGFLAWRMKCCTNDNNNLVDPTSPSLASPSSSQQNIKPSLTPSLSPSMPQQQTPTMNQQYMMPGQQQYMMPNQQQYMMMQNQQQPYMMVPPGQQFVLTPQGYVMVPAGSYPQ